MNPNFNLFRLNCMMDDGRSKNYNSIIASLVCELLYENDNKELSKDICYAHITKNLNINVEPDLFTSILEKNKSFQFKSDANSVNIRLSEDKFAEVSKKVNEDSLENFISSFVTKNGYKTNIKVAIENLLYESIYENINSFSTNNIKSILPDAIKIKYNRDEINAFNEFLDHNDKQKDIVLFSVFLKAVEFAILTSGKGVKQFSKDIFLGKEYCLDSNIIFRMLGVNGNERQESINKLIKSCIHQGVKFKYAVDTYKEVKRKIEATINDIKRGAENHSLEILQEMIRDESIQVNNSFITHYAQCKVENKVRSPDQYENMLLSDFRGLERDFNLVSDANTVNKNQLELLQNLLFDKKAANHYSRYTKAAAKVDAHNILLVRKLRGPNNFNYSDIKSFYLTTDKMLNSILASEHTEGVAETILPSQLYILHNALADFGDEQNKDYQAFNKFLKRRTTNFKYEGKDVLNFIDEIRNITTDTYTIKDVIKSYADKKYEHSLLNPDSEPEYKSFKEYAETYFDKILSVAQRGDSKYQNSLSVALKDFPKKLESSRLIIRNIDLLATILLIPISTLILKNITNNIYFIGIGTLFIESVKYIISSKTNLLSQLCKSLFLNKIKKSAFYITYNDEEPQYIEAANELIKKDINVYKTIHKQ